MISMEGAVTRSLLAASSPNPENNAARIAEIQAGENPLKRAALLAIHSMVSKQPEVFARAFDLGYRPNDDIYLASGTQSTVYRRGDTVLKVNDKSVFMTDRQRFETAEAMRHEHAAAVRHLGELVVPHRVHILPHPVLTRLNAIQIEQEYRPFTDASLFTMNSPVLSEGNFAQLCNTSPQATGQIGEFIERSDHLYAKEALLPDTNGEANLGLDAAGSLVLVDAQPIGVRHATVQQVIREQLNNLRTALQPAV